MMAGPHVVNTLIAERDQYHRDWKACRRRERKLQAQLKEAREIIRDVDTSFLSNDWRERRAAFLKETP